MIYYNLLTHFLINGSLDCFQFMAVMNKASMNILYKPFL